MTDAAKTLVSELLGEYDHWRKHRDGLMAKEEAGDFPDPDEWADSDDDGIRILEETMEDLRSFFKL